PAEFPQAETEYIWRV
ncbi:hypothetical protein CP8484711_0054B, partial [Chlamydia psittaci 84-8471/1]